MNSGMYKYIRFPKTGPISIPNGAGYVSIQGPVRTPVKLSTDTILNLLSRRVPMIECIYDYVDNAFVSEVEINYDNYNTNNYKKDNKPHPHVSIVDNRRETHIILINTEHDLTILEPILDKFYYVIESKNLYHRLEGKYDLVNWQNLNPTFIIPAQLHTGTSLLPPCRIPSTGVIDTVYAACNTAGTEDCEIAIEKCSNLMDNSWSNIFESNLKILSNYVINNENYKIKSNIINKGDYLRLNIIKDGKGISGLSVQVTIKTI